jgi:hypothetical protein
VHDGFPPVLVPLPSASVTATTPLTPLHNGVAWASGSFLATTPLTPVQNGVPWASNIANPANLDYPEPGSTTLTGAALTPDSKAPPLGKPASHAGDTVDPFVPLDQRPETLEEMLMGPDAKALGTPLVGSWGQLSESGKHTLLTKESGSDGSAALTAPYYREGDVPKGHANLAFIRVWSNAVIYTSASQGIMCQGSTLTIVTSSGETPTCLDLFSYDTRNGAQVWLAY